jgi:hypothetical protein
LFAHPHVNIWPRAWQQPLPTPPGVDQPEAVAFCLGAEEPMQPLRDVGRVFVVVRDGWHPDAQGGGVAVWGSGRYWEVRSSPFEVVDRG